MAEHRLPLEEQYPNNSNAAKERAKQPPTGEKRPAKVVKGKTRQGKKPLGRKLAQAFGASEGQGVIEYILYDIIIPATKNMIVDSIIDGAEMAILGEVRNRRRGSNSRVSRVSYDRVSYRDRNDYRRNDRYDRDRGRQERPGLRDYEDIVYDSIADAERVISQMIDMIEEYGQVTVEDLYDLAGLTPEYTVGNYGWTNLSSAKPRRIRDGYVLDLPRARLL